MVEEHSVASERLDAVEASRKNASRVYLSLTSCLVSSQSRKTAAVHDARLKPPALSPRFRRLKFGTIEFGAGRKGVKSRGWVSCRGWFPAVVLQKKLHGMRGVLGYSRVSARTVSLSALLRSGSNGCWPTAL